MHLHFSPHSFPDVSHRRHLLGCAAVCRCQVALLMHRYLSAFLFCLYLLIRNSLHPKKKS